MGLDYDNSIDMWSLGCVCAELFMGLPLFPGLSQYDQLFRVVSCRGLPPSWMIEHAAASSELFTQVSTSVDLPIAADKNERPELCAAIPSYWQQPNPNCQSHFETGSKGQLSAATLLPSTSQWDTNLSASSRFPIQPPLDSQIPPPNSKVLLSSEPEPGAVCDQLKADFKLKFFEYSNPKAESPSHASNATIDVVHSNVQSPISSGHSSCCPCNAPKYRQFLEGFF